MTAAVLLVPPCTAVFLGLAGGRLARRLPPATAVPLLTVATVVTALATGFVLAVGGLEVLARVPLVAELGRWSPVALARDDRLPVAISVLAGSTAAILLTRALREVVRSASDLACAALLCRRLGPGAQGLVIVEDQRPDAFALPGVPGRIVVSTAMVRALSADERRVLLAHEHAHLTHRHHLFVHVSAVAAAANPLLRPVARAVRAGVERWADEVAAATVDDRRLAAQALARAGLARAAAVSADANPARAQAPAAALAVGGAPGEVADRARALLEPPPPARRGLTAAVALLVLATCASTALTAEDTEQRFERAQAVYAVGSCRSDAGAVSGPGSSVPRRSSGCGAGGSPSGRRW